MTRPGLPCSPREACLARAEGRPIRSSLYEDDPAAEHRDEGACAPCGHLDEDHDRRGCRVVGCRCGRRGGAR